MYRSLSTDHIQEVARTHVQGDLDFEHVGFLLTTAPLSLFFWGRSIGTSVTSTMHYHRVVYVRTGRNIRQRQ